MARKKMSNKDIQGFFSAAYNGFFCKWRNNLPETDDHEKWAVIADEAVALINKYQEFEDDDFHPLSTIVQALGSILDDRKRNA